MSKETRPRLEIATHSLASALAAQEGGADRIELCIALPTGGLTPSPGLLQVVRDHIQLPIHVLIRPRLGDFTFTEAEVNTMEQSIEYVRSLGCEGVVVGCLNGSQQIEQNHLTRLLSIAGDMKVTYHRAFDFLADKSMGLETLVDHGITRVLTSGGQPSAQAGAQVLSELTELAADRIEVMPGAGITSTNLDALMKKVQTTSYHASAKKIVPLTPLIGPDLGDSFPMFETDVMEVRKLVEILGG